MQLGRTVAFIAMAALAACGGGGGGKKEAAEPETAHSTRVPIDPPDQDDDDDGDDDMQVEGLHGHLSPSEIQPIIENSWDDVQSCYAKGVGKLRYVGGQVELHFLVAKDGAVKHVHVMHGTLGSWPVEKCVLELLGSVHFPKPEGGEAEFQFPIDFPARGKTVAMDDGIAASDLGPKLPELDECREAVDGKRVPQVQVTVYVGAGGKVTSAGFAADGEDPIPADWAECAHQVAMSWKLTDPRGTVAKTTVTYAGR